MIKRKFDKLNIETSLLGFGCMRFPQNEDGTINENEAEKMIDKAILSGVNYIDTAYPYHNGASEPFVGRVLEKYERNSYFLATKLPMWKINTKEDVYETFNLQLERLNKDYVDFYLLHALNRNHFAKIKELGIVEICEEFRRQGKIKYLGFSFHDTYEIFEDIINYHNWDFCQIQFNYMDTEIQAGLKGYDLTVKKDIPVIIMEPIKGGLLANLPKDVSNMLNDNDNKKTDSSYALRFVASFDNVKVILSGMSNMEHVLDNLNTFNNYIPLSKQELSRIENVKNVLNSRVKNGCTGCKYCMPCPVGVNIPGNFYMWNEFGMYDDAKTFISRSTNNIKNDTFVNKCIKCGKCEKVCPQHLHIRKDLEKINLEYEKLMKEMK